MDYQHALLDFLAPAWIASNGFRQELLNGSVPLGQGRNDIEAYQGPRVPSFRSKKWIWNVIPIYAPCMVYLPTFGWFLGQILVNIPYMEHMETIFTWVLLDGSGNCFLLQLGRPQVVPRSWQIVGLKTKLNERMVGKNITNIPRIRCQHLKLIN